MAAGDKHKNGKIESSNKQQWLESFENISITSGAQ